MGNAGMYVHDAQGRLVYDRFGLPVVQRRVTRFRPGEFDDVEPHYLGGMVFRCNPDGSDFEVLGHNFRNNYEVAVDSFGNLWQSDNDDDGYRGVRINYVMEYGNYGYRDEMTAAGRWGPTPDRAERDRLGAALAPERSGGLSPTRSIWAPARPPASRSTRDGCCPRSTGTGRCTPTPAPGVVRGVATEKTGAGWSGTDGAAARRRGSLGPPCRRRRGARRSGLRQRLVRPGRQLESPGRSRSGSRVFRLAARPAIAASGPKHDFATAAGAVAALESPNADARFGALAGVACHGRRPRRKRSPDSSGRTGRPSEPEPSGCLAGSRVAACRGSSVRWPMTTRTSGSWRCERRASWRRDSSGVLEQAAADASPQVRREVAVALRGSEVEATADLWTPPCHAPRRRRPLVSRGTGHRGRRSLGRVSGRLAGEGGRRMEHRRRPRSDLEGRGPPRRRRSCGGF